MGLLRASTTMTAKEMVAEFYRQYCLDNPHPPTQKACWRGIRLVADFYKQRTLLELAQNGWDDVEFLKFIKKDRAEATWSKAITNIRRMGRWAVERGYLDQPPFQNFKGGSKTGRRHYVEASDIRMAITNCGDDDLRIIIALARFAGLRIPSDLRQLTWDRVNWERNVMTVYSPKTDSERVVPIFPDLRTELDYQWEKHGDKSSHVVISQGLRSPEKNLRSRFARLLKRCGIKPWPKIFQNLRASCETDFLNCFPIHQATAFIGNSPQIALQHYAIVTSQAVDAATSENPFPASCTRKDRVADKLHGKSSAECDK